MTDSIDNPYAVTESAEFHSTKGEFVLQGDKILCGSLLKLPQICLQTGATEDVVAYQPRIPVRSPWLWKLKLATGILAALAFVGYMAALFVLDAGSNLFGILLLMIVASGVAFFAAIGPMSLLAPSVKIHACVGRKQRRSFGAQALLTLVTGLPFWFVIFGTISRSSTFSIPALTFSDSWMPLILVVSAVAVSRVLRRLLVWHWRSTRDFGLNLRAESLNNGEFLVSGFSPEFLDALRRTLGNDAQHSREHVLS